MVSVISECKSKAGYSALSSNEAQNGSETEKIVHEGSLLLSEKVQKRKRGLFSVYCHSNHALKLKQT